MFTDLEGYTSLAHSDEARSFRVLEEQEKLVRPLLAAHRGKKIKSMGDGLLIEFPNARDAIECAVDLQRSAHEHNAVTEALPLRLRVGIHVGDVERRGPDILGDAVNIASRIEPLAEAGGICLSAQVYDQVHNKVAFQLQRLGPKSLKGVSEPIDVYRVVLPWQTPESGSRTPAPTRIAVLPFANISPDPRDDYFAEGMTEELITMLSRLRELRVIARTSVMSYKTDPKPISRVGEALGVTAVIEGSVRKAGDQLRITVQLIDVASEEHTWAETYDRRLDDVFAIQTEVAKHIADTLRIRLAEAERRRIEKQPEINPDSYLAYLKGRALMASRQGREVLEEAKHQFELALSIDSENARAHSGLADVLYLMGLWNWTPSREEAWTKGRAHVTRSLAIDPNLAEAHASLGKYFVIPNNPQYGLAETEFKRALTLNPSDSDAHSFYASILEEDARPDEALREYTLAEETDPRSVSRMWWHVRLLAYLRKAPEAWVITERLGKIAPDSPEQYMARAWSYYAEADFAGALREWEKLSDRYPEAWGLANIAVMLALTGESEKARRHLEELEHRTPRIRDLYSLGIAYAFLGDLDNAYRLLFESVRNYYINLGMIRNDPALRPLREDPRFSQLLEMTGLAERSVSAKIGEASG